MLLIFYLFIWVTCLCSIKENALHHALKNICTFLWVCFTSIQIYNTKTRRKCWSRWTWTQCGEGGERKLWTPRIGKRWRESFLDASLSLHSWSRWVISRTEAAQEKHLCTRRTTERRLCNIVQKQIRSKSNIHGDRNQ